jgi:serine protease AprX
VGIIDTGIDLGHPSLKDVEVVAWSDLVEGRTEPLDDSGHGTAMASIIAGRAPLKGGAEDVQLIVVRVLDGNGDLSDELIADGIDFCLDPDKDGDCTDGADIISLSLGGKFDEIDLLVGTKTQAAIDQAINNGVIVVAAAGNDPDAGDVALPGRLPEVISVGAVDRNARTAPFSSAGNDSIPRPDPNRKPEVVAPGVDIVTAHLDGLYAKGSGTSHATAFTTAVLAVALSGAPGLMRNGSMGGNASAAETVKQALMGTCLPLEGQDRPHDAAAGYGLIQAVALALALET